MMTPILVEITESSQVGEARRLGQKLAVSCGLDSIAEGRVSLIITEAATNIVRYGNGGLIILQTCKNQNLTAGVEILALDRGPGMRDVASCLVDGYSTGGTQGSGLGAIRRLSDSFDIYSAPGQGTAILCRVYPRSSKAEQAKGHDAPLTWGAISVPYPGEDVCGDIWAAHVEGRRGLFLVADGLGHGLGAADAAREAAAVFQQVPSLAPVPVLERCNDALRKTRGAAAAVAEIDLDRSIVRYTGIGNIVGSLNTRNACHHMVSHPGILGHSVRKFQEFTYSWESESILIMQSDGLSTRSDLSPYLGLFAHDPTLIAGVLFRDFRRGRDDATVIVVRALHPYSGLTEWTASCSM
ncbi:ATP-binding SpoIIE family protein phosphatase [Oligoflexus tunisiensis]|uniref:ATP-binding SpoIIE family protein phosphatase n=1 Tax=Oligoflexus tunisiensis TaxID=708132 RepID=UPI00114CF74B|nr:ATP-binding SpoIIE family protein phosphatase [Oligoflexus tunisiensis]